MTNLYPAQAKLRRNLMGFIDLRLLAQLGRSMLSEARPIQWGDLIEQLLNVIDSYRPSGKKKGWNKAKTSIHATVSAVHALWSVFPK